MKLLESLRAFAQEYLVGNIAKYAGMASVGIIAVGMIYGIYAITFGDSSAEESKGVEISAALNRAKFNTENKKTTSKLKHKPAIKQISKSASIADPMADAASGLQQGKVDPKHVYKIEPFGRISLVRACMDGSEISEEQVRQAAMIISERLVNDADRFSIWIFDDEAPLAEWKGSDSLQASDKEHCLWKISTSSHGDKTFKVNSIGKADQLPQNRHASCQEALSEGE